MLTFFLAHVLECGRCVKNAGEALDCNGECDKHIKNENGECQWRAPKSFVPQIFMVSNFTAEKSFAKECEGNINKYVYIKLVQRFSLENVNVYMSSDAIYFEGVTFVTAALQTLPSRPEWINVVDVSFPVKT